MPKLHFNLKKILKFMKKLIFVFIITHLFYASNSNADDQKFTKNQKVLKIGVLLPLTGNHKDVGQSFLRAIQLGLTDLNNKNIKIYPKDTKARALDTYIAAKEFEDMDINVVIGPLFYESLERLNEINGITFISLSNKIKGIPKNTISFGININSQIETLKNYFQKIKTSNILLLSPNNKFIDQLDVVKDSKIKFYRSFLYNTSPKKITGEIEKLTKYNERKKDLERRIKILEKSEKYKDKQEIKMLEQMHTLGDVSFDSVFVLDFGERLKSVLTSFMFADISNKKVNFFTVNQWFDKTLFNENALQNLHFPTINYKNLKKYEKNYFKAYQKKPNTVSILAYDALGLIYYCWASNNNQFKADYLYNKEGFKGLLGEFVIKNNFTNHKLSIYKVAGSKFSKVY